MEVKRHNQRNEQELTLAMPEYNAPTSVRSILNDKLYCIASVVNAVLTFERDRKMCSELKRKYLDKFKKPGIKSPGDNKVS